MEDPVKDQSSASGATGKPSSRLLRYPLRSATKAKEEKPPVTASAFRRGRAESSVSKSVSIVDISGKEKSGKPPRRHSIPSKPAASPSPASRSVGSITTPISEAKARRSTTRIEGRTHTSASNASISSNSNRRKFNTLSSSSYWLSQIKLSESAANHSVSLGFFKLALEAGCEPLQRMRDELTSYAHKHNLAELGEPVKELFDKYGILESFEQLQVSETCSHAPDEGTRSSDEDVRSSALITDQEQLKPKSPNIDVSAAKQVKKESHKEATLKNEPGAGVKTRRRSANTTSAAKNLKSTREKKTQKPKQESNKKKEKVVKETVKMSVHGDDEGSRDPLLAEDTHEENKENMEQDAPVV